MQIAPSISIVKINLKKRGSHKSFHIGIQEVVHQCQHLQLKKISIDSNRENDYTSLIVDKLGKVG